MLSCADILTAPPYLPRHPWVIGACKGNFFLWCKATVNEASAAQQGARHQGPHTQLAQG